MVKQREEEAEKLGSRVGQLGNVAEASAKRCMELERQVEDARARGKEGEAAIKQLAAKNDEIAGLRAEMSQWINEMKCLKDKELQAKAEVRRQLLIRMSPLVEWRLTCICLFW